VSKSDNSTKLHMVETDETVCSPAVQLKHFLLSCLPQCCYSQLISDRKLMLQTAKTLCMYSSDLHPDKHNNWTWCVHLFTLLQHVFVVPLNHHQEWNTST